MNPIPKVPPLRHTANSTTANESSMSDGTIEYRSEASIATIVINRPHKRNALTAAMCDELRAALERLRDSDDRVGILSAEGETFSAGADLTAPPAQFWRAVPDIGIDV